MPSPRPRRRWFCERCWNVAEEEECGICRDDQRDVSLLCVVEEARDIVAIERTGEFHGRYHVLLGAISPIDGIGPEQLKVRELLARLEPEGVEEVILCTNPNVEGEATALYLARLLKPLGVRVTRLASGLPVGGDLEYADELTLGRALEGRRDVDHLTGNSRRAGARGTGPRCTGVPPLEVVAGGQATSMTGTPDLFAADPSKAVRWSVALFRLRYNGVEPVTSTDRSDRNEIPGSPRSARGRCRSPAGRDRRAASTHAPCLVRA